MSLIGLSYYEKHFLYSNPIVQAISGLRPDYSFNNLLFQSCTITFYLLPLIIHQFYQLFTSDLSFESSLDLLQSMIAALCILCTYSTICLQFVTMQSIRAHIKYDYEQLSDENELDIFKEYNKQTKAYTYCFIVIFHLYFIGIITPCVVNVVLYHIGAFENVNFILPLPIHNVSNPGLLYYSLLIYQTIAIYIFLILGMVCFPSYLSFVQHACCQLSALKLKISQPFQKSEKANQTVGWNEKFGNEFEWIVDIIKHYTRAMEFVDKLNSLSKISYITVITLMMFLIILDFVSIFQLSKRISNTSKLVERGCYIGNSIIMTYINFYVGQRLIDHNTAAFDELCQIPFYNLSIKSQKLLLFVIARSMRPCEISIGDLFTSSHIVFSGLMQKALSFATVYYSVC